MSTLAPARRMRQKSVALVAAAGLLVIGLAVVFGSSARPVVAGPNCNASGSIDSEELAFLTLINQYRQQNGLGALALSSTLNRSAEWKSQHLGANAYFAHDDVPINRTWVQRLRDCGYTYNAWLGENIAAGNSTAANTFEQWRTSPGHDANMLGSHYTAIGIGRVYVAGSPYVWYWTTDFGSVADGYGTPAAPTATATRTPTPLPTLPPGPLPCADVTGDGRVQLTDVMFVAGHHGTTNALADLDNDGVVGLNDVLIAAGQFGSSCTA